MEFGNELAQEIPLCNFIERPVGGAFYFFANPVVVNGVTKYYTFGGSKVAMRQGAEVYYLSGDHLGSTSLTTDGNGAVVSEVRTIR